MQEAIHATNQPITEKPMKNFKYKSRVQVLAISLPLLVLIGCGGGSDSATTPVSVPSADTTAPTLAASLAIAPTNGSTDIGYAAVTKFTATEALSIASIKMACDGIDVPGSTTVSGAVATFTPLAPGYAASAKCTATVNAALTKDLAGNAFASNVAITNFTVKSLGCSSTATNTPPVFNGTALVAVCGNVFVDPTVAKNQYPQIVDSISTAIAADKAVYGALQSSQPDVVVCNTPGCGTYFAGTSLRNVMLPTNSFAGQYVAPRTTVVLTSGTYGRNAFVLAHEFSHVEVAVRLNGKQVPAWFDEGLATLIGNEPECTGVTGKGVADLTTLAQQENWNSYTGNSANFSKTYCQARAEVAAWTGKYGIAGVVQLLQSVSKGQSFSSLYGALLTQ